MFLKCPWAFVKINFLDRVFVWAASPRTILGSGYESQVMVKQSIWLGWQFSYVCFSILDLGRTFWAEHFDSADISVIFFSNRAGRTFRMLWGLNYLTCLSTSSYEELSGYFVYVANKEMLIVSAISKLLGRDGRQPRIMEIDNKWKYQRVWKSTKW